MFRPCIDLHDGRVKQIVGGTLADGESAPRTNYVSDRPAAWYARLYRDDQLRGGHVIMLGPGNESAALEALAAYPGGLQVGGGINAENAPPLSPGRSLPYHRHFVDFPGRPHRMGTPQPSSLPRRNG